LVPGGSVAIRRTGGLPRGDGEECEKRDLRGADRDTEGCVFERNGPLAEQELASNIGEAAGLLKNMSLAGR
jgi:hypothetical protein